MIGLDVVERRARAGDWDAARHQAAFLADFFTRMRKQLHGVAGVAFEGLAAAARAADLDDLDEHADLIRALFGGDGAPAGAGRHDGRRPALPGWTAARRRPDPPGSAVQPRGHRDAGALGRRCPRTGPQPTHRHSGRRCPPGPALRPGPGRAPDSLRRPRPTHGGHHPGRVRRSRARGGHRRRAHRHRRPRRRDRRACPPCRRCADLRRLRGLGSGQLEAEISDGAWIDVPALRDDIFTDAPEALWSAALERKGGMFRLVARMPEDPSLN